MNAATAEEMNRAARNIDGAAERMMRAVAYLDDVLERNGRLWEERIARLESISLASKKEGV